MTLLSVALLQLCTPGPFPDKALQLGERACRTAKERGADIALFPELWQMGYTPCPKDDKGQEEWMSQAISSDDAFVRHFQDLAKELDMAIVLTYLEKWEGGPRNTASVIDRHGEIVLTYAKVHTCDFGIEAIMTPGEAFHVTELDCASGVVNIGVMICYDREFPESARVLMLSGAEVILTPNACKLNTDRIGQFRSRAFENMVGVAMTNYAAPPTPIPGDPSQSNGHSVAFSGVTHVEHVPQDHQLVEAGTEEEIVIARFDLDQMRRYRESNAWGDAYRRPFAYASLGVDAPLAVFHRHNARRTQ